MKYILAHVNLPDDTVFMNMEFISVKVLDEWVIENYPNVTSYGMIAVRIEK